MSIRMAVRLRTVSRVGNQRHQLLPLGIRARCVGEISLPPLPRCRSLAVGRSLTWTVGWTTTDGRPRGAPCVLRCPVVLRCVALLVEPAQPVAIRTEQTVKVAKQANRVMALNIRRGQANRHASWAGSLAWASVPE